MAETDLEFANRANIEAARRFKAQRDIMAAALREIKRATIEGRVCDDVAWFDTITTLHDYCDDVLARISRMDEASALPSDQRGSQ